MSYRDNVAVRVQQIERPMRLGVTRERGLASIFLFFGGFTVLALMKPGKIKVK